MTYRKTPNSVLLVKIFSSSCLFLIAIWIGYKSLNSNSQSDVTQNVLSTTLHESRKNFPNSPNSQKSNNTVHSYTLPREKLQNSSSPTKDILRIINSINQLKGIRREVAISTFLSALADFENPTEATLWLEMNRDLLSKTLSSLNVGQGRDAYDDLLSRVASQCTENGVDFISAVTHLGNEALTIDVLPIKFKISGEWNEADLNSVDPATRKKIETKTIKQLALANFSNLQALRMMLDPLCSIKPNQQTTNLVIEREYFWKHTSEMMNTIENSQPSPKRDTSLIRAVDLLAEKDSQSALLWAALIQDSRKRSEIVSMLEKQQKTAAEGGH